MASHQCAPMSAAAQTKGEHVSILWKAPSGTLSQRALADSTARLSPDLGHTKGRGAGCGSRSIITRQVGTLLAQAERPCLW